MINEILVAYSNGLKVRQIDWDQSQFIERMDSGMVCENGKGLGSGVEAMFMSMICSPKVWKLYTKNIKPLYGIDALNTINKIYPKLYIEDDSKQFVYRVDRQGV